MVLGQPEGWYLTNQNIQPAPIKKIKETIKELLQQYDLAVRREIQHMHMHPKKSLLLTVLGFIPYIKMLLEREMIDNFELGQRYIFASALKKFGQEKVLSQIEHDAHTDSFRKNFYTKKPQFSPPNT